MTTGSHNIELVFNVYINIVSFIAYHSNTGTYVREKVSVTHWRPALVPLTSLLCVTSISPLSDRRAFATYTVSTSESFIQVQTRHPWFFFFLKCFQTTNTFVSWLVFLFMTLETNLAAYFCSALWFVLPSTHREFKLRMHRLSLLARHSHLNKNWAVSLCSGS